MLGQKVMTNSGYLGRALSCYTRGSVKWQKTSTLYLTAVKLHAITINCDCTAWEIPPQTIIEPPQLYPPQQRKRRRSLPHDVGKPRRRPSGRKRVKLKSVKRTRLHCLIGNFQRIYAVNHAIRRMRRSSVRGGPLYERRARIPALRNRFFTVTESTGRLWVPKIIRTVSVALVTIAQMQETNILVLSSRHHAWCFIYQEKSVQ